MKLNAVAPARLDKATHVVEQALHGNSSAKLLSLGDEILRGWRIPATELKPVFSLTDWATAISAILSSVIVVSVQGVQVSNSNLKRRPTVATRQGAAVGKWPAAAARRAGKVTAPPA